MAYVGIGYAGSQELFLKKLAENHSAWLRGDRLPRFFGDRFVVLYDSNTAREFIKKCEIAAEPKELCIYVMDRIDG